MKSLILNACVLTLCSAAAADQLALDVSPVNKVLKAGEKQNTWMRVGLEGFKLDGEKKRPGVNLALVLDKSGSMQGDKIKKAREAAIDAINLLHPDDIVSIVTYDSTVNVLVPATKLTEKKDVIAKIRGIQPGGNTALFAGVSKGAAEVRKFLNKERVNRVILLSDGLANVGPSSPGELGSLGKSLTKENITVSTLGLGLGYNEDLMVQLASTSGGNHLFIEKASELADIFRQEFDDVVSVVAQEVDIRISIPEGIRPIRVLGNDSDITGQNIVTRLSQIYSEQNRHVVIELEVPPGEDAAKLDLATVVVTYANMKSHEEDRLTAAASLTFSSDAAKVQKSINNKVLADVVVLESSERSKLATKYLDEGNFAACRMCLEDNVKNLTINALKCPSENDKLSALVRQNQWQLDQLQTATSNKDAAANRARKSFRGYQNEVDFQQRAKGQSDKK